jgi:hypothetical protein
MSRALTPDFATVMNLFPGSAFRNSEITDPKKWFKKLEANLEKTCQYIKKSDYHFNQFYPYYFDPHVVGVEKVPFETFVKEVANKKESQRPQPISDHKIMKKSITDIMTTLSRIVRTFRTNNFMVNVGIATDIYNVNSLLEIIQGMGHWRPKQLRLTPQQQFNINQEFLRQASASKKPQPLIPSEPTITPQILQSINQQFLKQSQRARKNIPSKPALTPQIIKSINEQFLGQFRQAKKPKK